MSRFKKTISQNQELPGTYIKCFNGQKEKFYPKIQFQRIHTDICQTKCNKHKKCKAYQAFLKGEKT
jgi:hypothetical protein